MTEAHEPASLPVSGEMEIFLVYFTIRLAKGKSFL